MYVCVVLLTVNAKIYLEYLEYVLQLEISNKIYVIEF